MMEEASLATKRSQVFLSTSSSYLSFWNLQLFDATGSISCAVTLPCSITGVTRSWQECLVGKESYCSADRVCLLCNRSHHILVTAAVVKRGRHKWLTHDQHGYILPPFALGKGVGDANLIARAEGSQTMQRL